MRRQTVHTDGIALKMKPARGPKKPSPGCRRMTHVFGDRVGVVDAVDALAHQHGLLLVLERLLVVAHDVVEPRQHPQTLGDLWNRGRTGGERYETAAVVLSRDVASEKLAKYKGE